MLAQLGCAEEDAEVDEELGYPPVYAKLCRHEDSAGLPTPFAEGPPQRFLPYAPHAEDFQHLKDWDTLFPVVAEKERDSSNLRKHAEELWQQLDHLGNAGFDPSKFRVDPYGNVVYWNADPSSPLAWDIDHWFPSSRGGKTELPNLRIVQWQAFLRKRDRLEFLVPWWDLQHGCSINQFLSAFAAKNADFRRRSFASFFAGGEDEAVAREHVGECRPWPQPFREKKVLCGLAAAAIVGASPEPLKLHTTSGVPRRLGSYSHAAAGTPSQRHWTANEAEAGKRGVSKFGLKGSWNEINAPDSTLANPSAAQVKDKFRVVKGASQNSSVSSVDTSQSDRPGRQTTVTTALQKELRVKVVRDEARREREEELTQLEETVTKLKLENEKAKRTAQELESLLKKRKKSVEKHRKLAARHSSYRLCLERVLRDTMHQAMAYKEQAQLTQEACNVLVARLECQKAVCEAVESELLQRHSKRVTLEAAAAAAAADGNSSRKGASLKLLKAAAVSVTRGQDLVDVSSCVSLHDNNNHDDDDHDHDNDNVFSASSDATEDEAVSALPREHQRKSLVRHAIKEYMTHPKTRVRRSEETAHSLHLQYDADSEETPESSSDSDFADDEMSPTIHISKDDTCNTGDDNQVVCKVSKLCDVLTSELQDFCTQNSTPCERDLAALDTPLPSADDASRSDSKREVQKDVISESTTKQPQSYVSTATAATYKQGYMDELLQHIRFLIPTPEARGQTVQTHIDEILLQQVLTTHLENMRSMDERPPVPNLDTDSDEQAKQNGKSNLDKWLQALLVKGTDSAGSSPGRDDESPPPILSPAELSQISLAAMQDSLERVRQQELVASDGANVEKPRSLRRALLRKLSVKHHQSELHSSVLECNESYCGERQSS